MTESQADLLSWNNFITTNFAVVPELVGKASEFQFEKYRIIIELPTADKLTDSRDFDSPLRIIGYKEEDGHEKPTIIAVGSVYVLVQIKERVSLPEEALNHPPNPIDLLTEEKQKLLNKLATTHGEIASKAFELWIRVLRWKSSNSAIGRPEIHGYKSGWSTYLLNKATRQRFWADPHFLTVRTYEPITLPQWQEVEEALKLGQQPPIHFDLMFDGIEQWKLGDLQSSIVDLAVACESYMRARITQSLPSGINNTVLKYIDEAPIQRVLDKFLKETLNDEQNSHLKSIRSTLHQLFDSRNEILHSGQKEDLTSADCKKYIEATKKLIAIG